jgi:sialidase-1
VRMTSHLLFAGLLPASLVGVLNAEPVFQETDVFVAGQDGIVEYRIPALVVTNEGTLLAVCDARVERRGDAPNNIDLVLKRSSDGGVTWGPLEIIKDLPDEQAACDACVLVDRQTGTIWILYHHIYPDMDSLKENFPVVPEWVKPDAYKGRVIFLHAIRSDDDGRTWSEPVDLTAALKEPDWTGVDAAPGTGIQTRSGRLIAPGYSRQGVVEQSRLLYSDDHGATWHITPGPGPQTNECQVVELADGALMLNMRSMRGKGCRAVATSADGGQTWSEIIDEATLVEPQCQASLIRYTDPRDGDERSRLLFSNPASATRREAMTIRLSYDEGRTWPVSKVVHAGSAAYSSLAVLPNREIGLLYEADDYQKITFAHLNLEWLTDGEDSL